MPEARENKQKIWTVSQVTRSLKRLFEEKVPALWISGEIANLSNHRSGHVYFTIKDARTQLSAAWFSAGGAARSLGLRNGLAVEAFGRISIYEPNGSYQLVVDTLRPRGVGELQQKFELLKRKLHSEGLFARERKRQLPRLPRTIGVITSTDGAALRDFLQILDRRFPNMHVRVFPSKVQGEGCAKDVAEGVRFFNRTAACDVIVVTRGGGSIEDLWGFNDEHLAREIASSRIPVVSAVGHEVDVTISDMVSDLRAPTPSAAAELVVNARVNLQQELQRAHDRMVTALRFRLEHARRRLQAAANHHVLREPRHVVRQYQQRIDNLDGRLRQGLLRRQQYEGQRLAHLRARLVLRTPQTQLRDARAQVAALQERATRCKSLQLQRRHETVDRLHRQLRALSPLNVLERGYAILLDGEGHALRDAESATLGCELRGILAEGELTLSVLAKTAAAVTVTES
jgi:exodeoxyribonuclease VII large subunit